MAKKLRIIWDNRFFNNATLTPSSAATNFPVANLKDRLRKRTWHTIGLTNQCLTVDFGAPQYCTQISLVNHNLTFDGKICVQASDDPAFGTLLKDNLYDAWVDIIGFGEGGAGEHGAGGVFLEEERFYFAPEPIRIIYFDPVGDDHVRARYWRLWFVDAANPDGYIEIGIVFLGLFDDYAKKFAYDWEYTGQDDSNITTSKGGQDWIDRVPYRRLVRLPWNAFSNEDKYWRFSFFLGKVGKVKDFIIDMFPDGTPSEKHFTTLYGKFTNIPSLIAAQKKSSTLEFEFIESL